MSIKDIREKETIEINFWTESEIEGPQSQAIENLLMKMAEARVFMEKLSEFHHYFRNARNILELGGGQCWASCIVKNEFPEASVIGTDIAPDAIASIPKWEHVYQVKLDGSRACRSYETGFPESSFDLVFAYAAAHHFVKHRRTFRELKRILAPGGVAFYLHEPTCNALMHSMAKRRVNKNRPVVPEDVLRAKELCHLAAAEGLAARFVRAPTLTNREPPAMIYYYGLRKFPVLQKLLPVSGDFIFQKPPNA